MASISVFPRSLRRRDDVAKFLPRYKLRRDKDSQVQELQKWKIVGTQTAQIPRTSFFGRIR